MPTGTQMLALARIRAQDADTANPAVSDAQALSLLNDILTDWYGEGTSRRVHLAASSSGATFAAGACTALLSGEIESVGAAYQSASSSVTEPVGEPLRRIGVEDIKTLLGPQDDGTFLAAGAGEDFDCWAIEPFSSGTSLWRIHVHPRLAVEKHLTLEIATSAPMSALSETPPLTRRDAAIVTRFLAWEMARLQKRPADFLDQLLARIPSDAMSRFKNAATLKGQPRVRAAVDYDG